MSWKAASEIADKIFTDLRAEHEPGFVRMVIRALTRKLNRDENQTPSPPSTINHQPSTPSHPPSQINRRDPGGAPPAEPLS